MGFFDDIGNFFTEAGKAVINPVGDLGNAVGDAFSGNWEGVGKDFGSLGLDLARLPTAGQMDNILLDTKSRLETGHGMTQEERDNLDRAKDWVPVVGTANQLQEGASYAFAGDWDRAKEHFSDAAINGALDLVTLGNGSKARAAFTLAKDTVVSATEHTAENAIKRETEEAVTHVSRDGLHTVPKEAPRPVGKVDVEPKLKPKPAPRPRPHYTPIKLAGAGALAAASMALDTPDDPKPPSPYSGNVKVWLFALAGVGILIFVLNR